MTNRILMRIVFSHDSCMGEATYLGKNYRFSYNAKIGYTKDPMPDRVFSAISCEVSTLQAKPEHP